MENVTEYGYFFSFLCSDIPHYPGIVFMDEKRESFNGTDVREMEPVRSFSRNELMENVWSKSKEYHRNYSCLPSILPMILDLNESSK